MQSKNVVQQMSAWDQIFGNPKLERKLKQQQEKKEKKDHFEEMIKLHQNKIKGNLDFLQNQIDLMSDNQQKVQKKTEETKNNQTYYQQQESDDSDLKKVFRNLDKIEQDQEQVYDTFRAQEQIQIQHCDLPHRNKQNISKRNSEFIKSNLNNPEQKQTYIQEFSKSKINFDYLNTEQRKKLMKKRQLSTRIY